jgi:hypothetical protein
LLVLDHAHSNPVPDFETVEREFFSDAVRGDYGSVDSALSAALCKLGHDPLFQTPPCKSNCDCEECEAYAAEEVAA